MLNSEYEFLLDSGTPIILKASNSALDRVLVVDTLQDGQMHAITTVEADELVQKGRLKA